MMLFYFTSEANSIAIDNGYSLTEGQGFVAKCRGNPSKSHDCHTMAYLKPKMTKYIKEELACRDKSIWEAIEPTFSSTVVEACGNKGCTPNALPNKTLRYCRNWIDYDCSMAHLKKTLVADKNTKTVPCEKLEYSGHYETDLFKPELNSGHPFLGGKKSDNRIYVVGFSFQSPYTMTLIEEYYVVPTLDLIGIIGGTLGMFIGFSFYGLFSDVIDIIQFVASKINIKGKSWFCHIEYRDLKI